MAAKRDQPKAPEGPPLLCSTAGCPYEARVKVGRVVRVKTFGGAEHGVYQGPWLNLCHSCRDEQLRRANREWCKTRGLDTLEKQMAFCRKAFKRGVVRREPVLREPGCDDEEIVA